MAQIKTNCPHCNGELEAQSEWNGMEVSCPLCQKNFTIKIAVKPIVPEMPVLTPVKAAPAAGKTFTFICPSCNGKAELPESLKGNKYECQFCFDEHIAGCFSDCLCPFCGGMVKENAKICKHCKKDLTRNKVASAPQTVEKFLFICPECDTAVELPEALNGKEYECLSCCETATATPAEERKCPKCGGSVKIKAAICKHCKVVLPPVLSSGKKGEISPLAPVMNTLKPLQEEVLTFQTLANKSWSGFFLWNLLWPGMGHVYLGQQARGVRFALVFIPIMILLSLLACVFRIAGIGIMIAYAMIVADALRTMIALHVGENVGKNAAVPNDKFKEYMRILPSGIKSKYLTFLAGIIFCLLLGISGPGLLGWIGIIVQFNQL